MTVNATGVVFDATLRLSVTTGLDLSAELGDDIKLGAGASAQVYADLARFRTNVTPSDESHVLRARDGAAYADDCQLPVVETYEFGLGANAGAYVAFNGDTWGPSPNTSVQIFYTTLLSACAVSATATATASGAGTAVASGAQKPRRTSPPELGARDGTSLTLASTPVTYTVTNVFCQSAGLRDCPASLQSTVQETKTSTYYTSLPSGSEITAVPATTTAGGVVVVQSFGDGANKVTASTGSPKSYVPPASSTTSGTGPVESALDDAKDGFDALSDSNKRLVIGLSAGVGGALLIALVAGVAYVFLPPTPLLLLLDQFELLTSLIFRICIKRRTSIGRAQDTQALLVGETGQGSLYSPRPFLLTPSARPKWDSGSDLSITQHVEQRSPGAYSDPMHTSMPLQPRAAF